MRGGSIPFLEFFFFFFSMHLTNCSGKKMETILRMHFLGCKLGEEEEQTQQTGFSNGAKMFIQRGHYIIYLGRILALT